MRQTLRPFRRVLRGGGLLRNALLVACLGPPFPLAAQAPDVERPPGVAPSPIERPVPEDTYADPAVQALLERARLARMEVAEGLESYEGRMWERAYVGISGPGFRRERGAFDMERVSRIRWTREGDHVIRWEGARRDSPALGYSSAETEARAAALARELAGSDEREPPMPPPLAFDPGSDRIAFGGEWALNPLADTAAYHYRFASGDTLRVALPGADRTLLLGEVRVEPRRTEFRLVSASLWFDLDTGALVRAGYRPARPFDWQLDAPEEEDGPPGFLNPVVAEIRYVTVDHGLYDLRWWIPRRFTFEGEARIANLVRSPFSLEWTVGEVRTNEPSTLIPSELPPGWILREAELERDGEPRRLTVVVPPPMELVASRELGAAPAGTAGTFSAEELRELERTLVRLSPGIGPPGVRLAWGLQEGITRYNRIEGISTGMAAALSLPGRFTLRTEGGLGAADREPRGELRLQRGTEGRGSAVAVFRRLERSSEWSRPHGLTSSLNTLLLGREHAPFHRAWGVEGRVQRGDRPFRGELRLFVERQGSAVRGTHAHLGRLWSDRGLPENPPADPGWWAGSDLSARWEAGADPERLRGFGAMRAEGALGASGYLRGWTSAGLTGPLPGRLSGAVEAGLGWTAGDLPLQRRFFPGGPAVFRGARAGELVGEAFWFTRTELAAARPGARIVLFLDAIEIGPRAELGRTDARLAAGVGASFMDGLVRLDVARRLRAERGWTVFFYLDGLF